MPGSGLMAVSDRYEIPTRCSESFPKALYSLVDAKHLETLSKSRTEGAPETPSSVELRNTEIPSQPTVSLLPAPVEGRDARDVKMRR